LPAELSDPVWDRGAGRRHVVIPSLAFAPAGLGRTRPGAPTGAPGCPGVDPRRPASLRVWPPVVLVFLFLCLAVRAHPDQPPVLGTGTPPERRRDRRGQCH